MSIQQDLSRRGLLKGSAGLAIAGTAGMMSGCTTTGSSSQPKNTGITKGRLKQSIVHWCFAKYGQKWTNEKSCEAAVALGCQSVELVGPEKWPTLKQYGLTCAIAPNGMSGPPFVRGYCNLSYHDELVKKAKAMIDAAAAHKVPSVIAFTGFNMVDVDKPDAGLIPHDEAFKNTVSGLKKIVGHAEKSGITICLEHLNSRVSDNNDKGHPGYYGDDVDNCADIIKAVGSPNMKLLFDIYHVQIMNGDLVTRIKQYADIIGHIHTAGNPGRHELDDTQEISYSACMQALADVSYKGYVGQEFIPTGDPMAALTDAVALCDV